VDDKQFLLSYRPTKKVEIGGRQINCRSLTLDEMDALDKKHTKGKKFDELEWAMDVVLLGVVNEAGQPLFKDGERELLRQMGLTVLVDLANAIFNISTFSEEKSEEVEKNSEETQSDK
jgi:hypothetical protein